MSFSTSKRRHAVPVLFNRKPGMYVTMEAQTPRALTPRIVRVVGDALPVELVSLGMRYRLSPTDDVVSGGYAVLPAAPPARFFELTLLLTAEPWTRPWWAFWRKQPEPQFSAALIGDYE